MIISQERYTSALERNIAECSNAILKRRAWLGLHGANSKHGLDFFRIARHALYNDFLAHTMRVLDHHRNATSLWYFVRCDEAVVKDICKETGLNLDQLDAFSRRLQHIRDKTHFHIDKDAVTDTREIWV